MSLFRIDVTRDERSYLIRLVKAAGGYDQMLKEVSFTCDKCGAFVIKTTVLFHMLERLIDTLDNRGSDDLEFAADDYDDLWDFMHSLIKPIMLTDEEWTRYFTHGLPEYRFAHDNKGELLTDDDGNPMAYVSDEVVIELDDQCECGKILSQLKDGNKP